MGRLPAAMPSTISAADHLRRSALPSDDRRRALDLLLALAAVECHASTGGPAVVPPGLLRDLVIITGRLAGRSWLDANADRTAAFTALQATWEPPPLAGLDEILARVLSDRFRPALTEGSGLKRQSPLRPDRAVAEQAPRALSVSSRMGVSGGGGLGDPVGWS